MASEELQEFEILQDRIKILAGELERVAEDMHIYMKFYEDLETIAILNKIAPRLFVRIRAVLWDAIYLAMARVADRAEYQNGNKNISFARIEADLKEQGYCVEHVTEAVEQLNTDAGPIRELRNKLIAHLDDETVRNDVSFAPEGGFLVEKFIEQSQVFLDAVMQAIGSGERYSVKRDSYQKHADALLLCLRYVAENWTDLEQSIQNSNVTHGLPEQLSQKRPKGL